MKPYPALQNDSNATLKGFCDFVQRERINDVNDRNSFPQQFIGGRRTARVPSSSTDVENTDAVGDVCITSTYVYFLINASGTIEWVRLAVGTF